MRQTSNSNIVDYRIVTERSPLDRKMVNAHLAGEKSPKLKPQFMSIRSHKEETEVSFPSILSPNQMSFLEKIKNSSSNPHAFASRQHF